MTRDSLQLFFAWLCLLLGISIYLLFRSRGHLGFILLDSVGMAPVIDALRGITRGMQVPEFVRFCLPDGLWTASYILFSDHYNRSTSPRQRLLWASVIPLVGSASEMLQLCQLLPGVFDPLDLVCYTLPLFIYYIIQKT